MAGLATRTVRDPQSRLMNLLYDHDGGGGMTASVAMWSANIDLAQLIELYDGNLIWASGANGIAVHLPGSNERMLKLTRLKLTVFGRTWVLHNPVNKLLRAMRVKPRGEFRLYDAVRASGDQDQVRALVDEGWATLHYAGDQRETAFVGTGGEQFRHPRDYVLIATPKVATVLPPAASG